MTSRKKTPEKLASKTNPKRIHSKKVVGKKTAAIGKRATERRLKPVKVKVDTQLAAKIGERIVANKKPFLQPAIDRAKKEQKFNFNIGEQRQLTRTCACCKTKRRTTVSKEEMSVYVCEECLKTLGMVYFKHTEREIEVAMQHLSLFDRIFHWDRCINEVKSTIMYWKRNLRRPDYVEKRSPDSIMRLPI